MKIDTDIIVIGAGPIGLSFCRSLKDTNLNITIIEKNDLETLENPPFDGREIALTHSSKEILKNLGAWDYLSDKEKFFLREAKVINGNSPYALHFPTPNTALGKPADTLGYLISNHNIRKSLYAKCKNQKNITWINNAIVTKLNTNDDIATVKLDNKQNLNAKLIIAADSRFSSTRRQMGIPVKMNDFGRTVIVFRMQHTISNENVATECFYYGRTLAILPLTEYLSSMVVTINSSDAERIWNMDAKQTKIDIMEQLDGKLGDMELVSDKHKYPLVGVHAKKFYAKRYALIGDAAVGMHPVTAHGFNLGLQSQNILSNLLKEATNKNNDIYANDLLEKYSRKHMLSTLPLYHGTNAIVKLFTAESTPAKLLRHTAIHAGNLLIPFKKIITKQLTG